jgi:toxin FitB
MLVLDTNVLAESVPPEPDQSVAAWLRAQPQQELFTTIISLAEMAVGLALMPAGKRRAKLEQAVESIFRDAFADRLLPFDEAAARSYPEFAIARQRSGLHIAPADAQIVAIARSRGARGIVTRDLSDFRECGLPLINTWAATR